jgi:hypothetical protein
VLASDLNNTDFVGAMNPDDALYVKFEMHIPEDPNKSMAAGRKVFATKHVVDEKGVGRDTGEPLRIPYVTIMKPGDSTSIIHVPVREDHKHRWPRQWLSFQIEEGLIDGGADLPGWKLEDWPEINQDPESLRNLKHMRFYTVEQIAGASDAQVQRMGLGGMGIREAAKHALRAKVGLDVRAEIAAKDKVIHEQGERLARLEALFMKNAEPVAADPIPEKPKRKYNRKAQPQASG